MICQTFLCSHINALSDVNGLLAVLCSLLASLINWLCCADLADNENIIEVHVIAAELQCATGANFAGFVELNFFGHATQATPVIEGTRPVSEPTSWLCTIAVHLASMAFPSQACCKCHMTSVATTLLVLYGKLHMKPKFQCSGISFAT